MAREIIQNADDAGASKIRFSLEPNCLRVWNNERFQSCGRTDAKCPWEVDGDPSDGTRKACDFHAISTVGSGNKYRDPSLIGRFGIGFVSVYQITDTPIIRSQGVQIQLDPLEERNHVSPIDGLQGSEFELPWAFDAKSPIREALSASAIVPSDLDSVQTDLISVANDCLLFLRNLSSIEIIRGGKVVKHVKRKDVGENQIQLSVVPENRLEDWYVLRSSAETKAAPLREKYPAIEQLARQTDLQIAFNLSEDETWSGRLFAYLPTEQESPVPCHINADFFPEQNRKALVLSGEQHERHWNEMLLEVSAREIAQHLPQLCGVLGPAKLWKLIDHAFEHRESAHFGRFWKAIKEEASGSDILWTSGELWISCDKGRIPPGEATEDEERALTHISVDLVHRTLRPYQNALQALGARRLTLGSVVDALEIWDQSQLDTDTSGSEKAIEEIVRPLWAVTNSLFPQDSKTIQVGAGIVTRLQKVRFVPKANAALAPIDGLYRLPQSVKNTEIQRHVGELPLVDQWFSEFDNLYELIDMLSFDRLLIELSERVKDQNTAEAFFGSDPEHIKQFYRFLSSYPIPEGITDISSVASSPILVGHGRYLKPTEAVLPGGFEDPVGRFDTLDIRYYDDRSQEFLRDILKVKTLTLEAYVKDHLAEILVEGLSDDQYIALLLQLTSHSSLLENDETRAVLRELPLVKTQDGQMRRPRECYFKTPELSELLGNQDALWVDKSVFDPFQKDVVQAFLARLGMRHRPSLEHALDRIDEVVQHAPSENTQRAVSNLLQFVFQVFNEDNIADREDEFGDEIQRLRYTEWLPALKDSALDTEAWYAPHELYQPFRAAGFDSQVPVLAVRQTRNAPLTGPFLDFLGVPAVPGTSVIVEHLAHCAQSGKEASELAYQILNEKLLEEEDPLSVERLRATDCIYSSALKKYVAPNRVFWSRPRLSRYCFQAPDWMHRHKDLFDFLGVAEEPHGDTYAGVLVDIANEFGTRSDPLPTDVQLVHGICLDALATEAREAPSRAHNLLEELLEHPFLLTLAGSLAFADEVVVRDSPWLAEPFGDELNGRLVHPAAEHSEVFDWLGLKPLSSVTHLEAIRLGEEIADEEATERIAERRDLLLWLFSGIRKEARQRIFDALNSIKVSRTDHIQVRSVFDLTDPPIVSTPKSETVLFDSAAHKLFLHLDLGDTFWIPALRAIFSTLIPGDQNIDVRQYALSANHVLLAPSAEEARKQLQQAGFTPPSDEKPRAPEFEETDLGEISADHAFAVTESEPEPAGEEKAEEDQQDTGPGVSGGTDAPPPSETDDDSHVGEGTGRSEAETERRSSNEKTGESKHRPLDGDGSDSGERKTGSRRTEWMRSYVVPQSDETADQSHGSRGQQERNMAIDEAAMNTAIEYEVTRQCSVERMPHFNPGYDIISRSKTSGEKRLIEVKGLDGEWTERGVKLTRTQIMNAEEYGDEYWLYVVEHALDPKIRKIHAIQNPFFKAAEFWFDYVWRNVADEEGGDLKSRFIPGRRVRVEDWGEGTIIEVQHFGIASRITIDFTIHGKKYLPFNMNRMELVE
ncbi:protein NO VEIN domain-containing protein [Nisaea sp.]|uniref:protein NO VEIN domain-containing protein n=1 Tax=Nisaea sp. TaxID=2024842 RepID=UPI002B277783|nr:DUF3883 domain-containing protein [Nisaea sp.]